MAEQRRLTSFQLYVTIISFLGLSLFIWGLIQIPNHASLPNFFLLIGLIMVAGIVTTSSAVSGEAGITYSVGSAVSMAAIPIYGSIAAALLMALHSFTVWLVKPTDTTTWKKSWSQLAFNTGMHTIAMYVAGVVFMGIRSLFGADTIWGQIVPWLPAAFVFEELNLWLLIGVLRLQLGPSVKLWNLWREDRWASQITILVLILGGGTLAYAMQQYDWVGIVIFFWPILLSAYAFRLYVQQMQEHLANLEQIVADRTRDLAELNRQKDAYLAVLTHDMMTPLSSIRLCAEELEVDPAAAVENPSLITFLLRSQHTLFNIVRNILDIEKLQAGGSLSSNKVPCDLAPILTNVIEILQNEATEKRIKITHTFEQQPLMMYADRQQMERMLMNLLANAVKYTPQGGIVQVDAYRRGEHVFMDFTDSGYGIPAEELPYIFDRFRRVEKHKDKATGTGLGLAITKALVEEHKGQVTVLSEVGKGSTFTVKLPIGIEKSE